MRYNLRRISDSAGDTGPMSRTIKRNTDGSLEEGGPRPRIGFNVIVGSPYARTYDLRDYWVTTTVQEILEETENRMKFRTNNSIYEWEQF